VHLLSCKPPTVIQVMVEPSSLRGGHSSCAVGKQGLGNRKRSRVVVVVVVRLSLQFLSFQYMYVHYWCAGDSVPLLVSADEKRGAGIPDSRRMLNVCMIWMCLSMGELIQ